MKQRVKVTRQRSSLTDPSVNSLALWILNYLLSVALIVFSVVWQQFVRPCALVTVVRYRITTGSTVSEAHNPKSAVVFLHNKPCRVWWRGGLWGLLFLQHRFCYFYASPSSGEAYRYRRLTTNFEL